MPKFRKKPVVIDAAKFDGKLVGSTRFDGTVLPRSCPDWFPAVVREYDADEDITEDPKPGEVVAIPDGLMIGTLEGVMLASAGDWIIRGVQGELYPCRPDIFEQTYEPA